MDNFAAAMEVMTRKFSRDCQFAFATFGGSAPSVRFVDAYFDGKSFFVVTYSLSQKVKDIEKCHNVSLCTQNAYSFSGTAYNIGHPLAPDNAKIREKLTSVFSGWYFKHNDESDKNMCYLRIDPIAGFFHDKGTGYKVNFLERTAKIFPFDFDIVKLTED